MNTNKNPAAGLDEHFAKEKGLTLPHLIPGMLFVMPGAAAVCSDPARKTSCNSPLVVARLSDGKRSDWREGINDCAARDHRRLGREIGDFAFLFGSFFLIALGKALWHAMHRDFDWQFVKQLSCSVVGP